MTTRPATGHDLPNWLREVDVALAANPQVAVTGNLRDFVLVRSESEQGPPWMTLSATQALQFALRRAGHRNIVGFNVTDGATPLLDDDRIASRLISTAASDAGKDADRLTFLAAVLRAVVTSAEPVCLIVEDASRLAPDIGAPSDAVHDLLVTAGRALVSAPLRNVPGPHRTQLYNTVFWLIDNEGDLPRWLVGSDLMRVVSIPMPTFGDRWKHIKPLLNSLPGVEPTPLRADAGPVNHALIDSYAALTSGMTLRSIGEVNRLAIDSGIAADDIDDAVRMFRVGVPDNPWLDDALKDRIRAGSEFLGSRVYGQNPAVRRSLDILIRSTMGLTGAQTTSSSARPQGVLFFAGPTGVGKTELAKSMAELVFGRKDAFLRFDMSEFASEHAEARLIGAPPGYIGHHGGGELTNAVRQQPFRLILFDEIEKAHPRILDKFLQVLEDGRLTDGNGSTVYFSETLLVFTSNLGVYTTTADGERIPVVARGTDYATVESTIRRSVAEHFTSVIGRPELLNRLGDNIVVFDYISEPIALDLVDLFVRNTVGRVLDVVKTRVSVADAALAAIRAEALGRLDFGGRGVATAVETTLVNPLARALFDQKITAGEVTVTGITKDADNWQVHLQ